MTNLRRSTRNQQNRSHVPAVDENSDEMSKFSEDLKKSEDPDAKILHTPHKPRPKRQKVEHTATENAREGQMVKPQRPDKNVRGRRGHLKLMTEMPLDTLFEIFRLLDPLDLLHLSWASKSLHALIMGRSSIYLWEEAYARVYESESPPPRCPEDVNLAQYTHFLYNQKCMICHTRKGAYTSWMMRLRACKHCLDSDLFTTVFHAAAFLEITANRCPYYRTSDVEKLNRKEGSEELRKLLKTKMERMEGTSEFDLWQKKCSKDRSDDLSQRRAQRSIAIFKKLEEIGWSESDIREINNGRLPGDLPGLGTVKKLTNRDWESIRPKIERVLSVRKENHLNILKIRRLNKRWDQFEKSFEEWNNAQTLDRAFRPHGVDILVMEPFFTTVFMSDTEGAEFAVADIDHAAQEWIEWRNGFVFSVLPQDLQDRYLASKSSLPLLAIFRFFSAKGDMLDKVCGNRLNINQSVPQSSNEREIYDVITRSIFFRSDSYPVGPWKWICHNLKFHTKLYQVTKDILEYLEMDPYTTTLAQFREYDQKFICSQCKTPYPFWLENMINHDLENHYPEEKERSSPSLRWVRVEDENALECGRIRRLIEERIATL